MLDIENTRRWFRNFTAQFGKNGLFDSVLAYKIGHSERVAQNALAIAESEHWDTANEHNLCFAIGLLHDTGRFQQYEKHKTFKDTASEDHADLGVAILQQEFDWSYISAETKSIVLCAIKNHNKLDIADDVPENALRYTKMIRDADKIDIFFQFQKRIDNGTISDLFPWHRQYKGLTQDLVEDVKRTGKGNYKFVKSLYDFRLIELCWGLDLNFAYSIKTVKNAGLFDRILADLSPLGIDALCAEIMMKINSRGELQ